VIRPITDADVEAAAALRREALLDAPLAFAASPEGDLGSDPEAIQARIADAPDSMTFGAFEEGRLVGLVSVFRETHAKRAHRANVFAMYVTAAQRRRGFAAQLLEAAILHAEAQGIAWLRLGVSESAPGARRLYEAAGFQAIGEEPDALRHGGQSASETQMALALPRPTVR